MMKKIKMLKKIRDALSYAVTVFQNFLLFFFCPTTSTEAIHKYIKTHIYIHADEYSGGGKNTHTKHTCTVLAYEG